MKSSRFIVFEGVEGVGKTTQIQLLRDFLLEKNFSVYCTREPGGTPEADEIRKCIVRSSKGSMLPLTELFLIEAARVEHVQKILKPKLSQVDYVICDRYIYSSIAYQGYASGLDLSIVNNMNTLACDGIFPDDVILLDLDPKISLSRSIKRLSEQESSSREDRFENEDLDFHHKVRQGFLVMAQKEPSKFHIINADKSVEQLHLSICKALELS